MRPGGEPVSRGRLRRPGFPGDTPFVEQFAEQGWLEVAGIFDHALIDELRQEFDRQYDELVSLQGDHRAYLNVGDMRLMLPVRLSGAFLDDRLLGNPLLLFLLGKMLGEDLLLDSATCVVSLPGAPDQRVHRDHEELFPERPSINEAVPTYAVTVIVPLIDLTAQTGTTKVYPGTHRGARAGKGEARHLARGGCLMIDYRLLHHGTANTSDIRRPVLYLVYSRPWFTDVMNFRRGPRINIDPADLPKINPRSWPLFRRLAAKGAVDKSEKELFPAPPHGV